MVNQIFFNFNITTTDCCWLILLWQVQNLKYQDQRDRGNIDHKQTFIILIVSILFNLLLEADYRNSLQVSPRVLTCMGS